MYQNSIPISPSISGKGTLKDTSYAGYVVVTVSTASTSAFISYTVDNTSPTCNPGATRQPTSFTLSATSEVTAFYVHTCIHSDCVLRAAFFFINAFSCPFQRDCIQARMHTWRLLLTNCMSSCAHQNKFQVLFSAFSCIHVRIHVCVCVNMYACMYTRLHTWWWLLPAAFFPCIHAYILEVVLNSFAYTQTPIRIYTRSNTWRWPLPAESFPCTHAYILYIYIYIYSLHTCIHLFFLYIYVCVCVCVCVFPMHTCIHFRSCFQLFLIRLWHYLTPLALPYSPSGNLWRPLIRS
jgi:hypothetical protein